MLQENKAGQVKTVYFLGAGASAASDFGLPVMQGFFKSEDFPEEGGNYPKLKGFLDILRPNIAKMDINLEEIITHLELTTDGFNWGFNDSSLYDIKRELYQYIKCRLDCRGDENKPCSRHLKLFEKFNPEHDSIITLNYDLVVDNVLNNLAKSNNNYMHLLERMSRILKGITDIAIPSPTLNSFDTGKGFYIKLHGSLNWIYCPMDGCPNNHHFFINEKENDYIGKPCSTCGTSLELVVIPPSMKKSFEKFPKLGLFWHLAFNELKSANRIIAIGMSFPDSDYYLKWLIQQAMIDRKRDKMSLPELTIVNKDTAHIEKNKKTFGINTVYTFDSLDKYIANKV